MSRVGKWIRRLGAAVLVVAALLGCGAGCGPAGQVPAPVGATPVSPVGPPADVVGVWRVGVNSGPPMLLMAFWSGGLFTTTDPGQGAWRPRSGGAEGTWDTPLAGLSVSFVVLVTGDRLIGTGLVFDQTTHAPGQPIKFSGSRLNVDDAAVAAVTPPHT